MSWLMLSVPRAAAPEAGAAAGGSRTRGLAARGMGVLAGEGWVGGVAVSWLGYSFRVRGPISWAVWRGFQW